MITEKNTYKTQVEGFDEEISYRTENNSAIADILVKKIYQNPIAAVVRELGTNAWDSHIDAGNENTRFDVIAPTSENLLYTIRDYGTGLSQNQMKELYTVIGLSNRNTSNMFTGAMGLGSKAPFAYTQSFVTTSYYNKQKIVCVNYIDKNGEFKMSMSDPEPSEEPTGLKIEIPVNKYDVYKFKDEIRKVFKWFPLFPNTDVAPPKEKEPRFAGNGWEIKSGTTESFGYGECNAVMGNVCYRVGNEYVPKNFNNLTTVLFFDIGEVNIVPGRETLRYNDKTVKAIENKYKTISTEIVDIAKNRIANADCYYDACIFYSALLSTVTFNYHLSLFYKKRQLVQHVQLDKSVLRVNKNSRADNYRCSTDVLPTRRNIPFTICDISTGKFKAAKKYARDTDDGPVYLIDEEETESFEKSTGLDTSDRKRFPLLSTYYEKATNRRSRPKGNRSFSSTFRFMPLGNSSYTTHIKKSGYWEPYDVDMNKGGIYVDLLRYLNKKHDIHALYDDISKLGILPPKDTFIIGVKKSETNQFKNSNNWTHLFDYIATEIINMDYFLKVKLETYLERYQTIFGMPTKFPQEILRRVACDGIEDKTSEIYKVLSFLTSCREVSSKAFTYKRLLGYFFDDKYQTDISDRDVPLKNMQQEYPVLNLINFSNVVIDTINVINKHKNND